MGHPGAGDHGPRRGERQVREMIEQQAQQEDLVIATREATLRAILAIPPKARSVVLFAHGAGSSRHSPRNQHVAEKLQEAGLATLLLDLLTEDEERIDMYTGRLRFDIPFLAGRLESATGWILAQEPTSGFDVGYFGASTGAAAALVASVQRPEAVRAIVSRGGRPDLALNVLPEVKPPVLLIVGGQDLEVLEMNRQAAKKLATEHKLVVVPGATHLFEEPGKLDTVADLARAWFARHMRMPAEVHSAGGGRPNHIDAYSYGRMRVSGDDFDEDLIVFPDKVLAAARSPLTCPLRPGERRRLRAGGSDRGDRHGRPAATGRRREGIPAAKRDRLHRCAYRPRLATVQRGSGAGHESRRRLSPDLLTRPGSE
jgi:putative phosphoribosyl transferase